MKKYLMVFKISWQELLAYRFNFLMNRLRSIIVLLLLYFLWLNLSSASGYFAGFSAAELFTYVLGVNLLRPIIFGTQTRQIATDINDGSLSKYLTSPVNYFGYHFFLELAERSLNFIAALVEVFIFFLIIRPPLFIQSNPKQLFYFLLSVILSVFLYFFLSLIINFLAFWSRQAMGPRFLFEWFLEFASGAYFPLSILGKTLFSALSFLPFMYIIYFPLSVYLNRYSGWQTLTGISLELGWLACLSCSAVFIWRKGLKKYSGEGM